MFPFFNMNNKLELFLMKKKITMQDIANMCGVSVASVSYVLNDKKDSRITEATKQKILQIANLYMYRSNPYARSLATGEIHNILFFYGENDFPLYQAEVLRFINHLSTHLRPYKYNITIAPNNMIAKYNYVDAIITYRVNKETFMKLGELNFIPLISIDCFIKDNLFFEINNSFSSLSPKGFTYFSLPYLDDKTITSLKERFDVRFIVDFKSLEEEVTKLDKPLIVFNSSLHHYLDVLNVEHQFYDVDKTKKFDAIIETLNLAINREESTKHQYFID